MATKKDLEREVAKLNERYCKNTRNHLIVHQAYGGYSVELTGKTYKRGKKSYRRKGSIPGAVDIGNPWHDTATKTLASLHRADSQGDIRRKVRWHERNPRRY